MCVLLSTEAADVWPSSPQKLLMCALLPQELLMCVLLPQELLMCALLPQELLMCALLSTEAADVCPPPHRNC